MTAYELAQHIASIDPEELTDNSLRDVLLELHDYARVIVESQTANPELVARYRDFAKAAAAEEGVLEIDNGAQVSIGDDEEGAYVEAWYWVDRSDIEGDDDACPA